MAATCAALPTGINKIVNIRVQQYMEEGMSINDARIKAVTDVKSYLQDPIQDSFGSTAWKTQHPYTDVSSQIIRNQSDITQIFDQLGTLEPNNKVDSVKHQNQLNKVVKELIVPLANQLAGTEFVVQTSDKATNPKGTFTKGRIELKISSIAKPFLNKFRLSFQEITAHEFVHAVTATAYRVGNQTLRTGIKSLYEQARATIKPSDFSRTVDGVTSTDKENQEFYDYIFNNEDGQGVEEFIAFGNTNEMFRNILNKIQVKADRKGNTLKEKVEIIFERMVNYLVRKTFHIKGDNVGQALEQLTKELAGVTQKGRNWVDILSYGLEATKWAGSKTLDQIVRPITYYANKSHKPGQKRNPIRAGIFIWQNWKVGSKMLNFGEAIYTTINNIVKHKEYFFFNLILKLPQELAGMNVTNKAWHDMLRHSKHVIDGARHKVKDAAVTRVREILGSVYDDDDKRSLTSIIIMSDLDDLLTHNPDFTFQDYRTVLTDAKDRQNRRDTIETKLKDMFGIEGSGYIRQAIGLGMYMQTKGTINDGYQALNAYQIARGDWDTQFNRPSNWKDAIPLIQQLKTLYALEQTTQKDRDVAVKLYDSQVNVSLDEDNGFNDLLSMNKLFKQESLNKLFSDDPALMTAGYMRDLNAMDVSIKVSSDPANKNLLDQGYIRQEDPLGQSPLHNAPKNYLYVSNYNGLVPYNKMATSLTSRQVAGTTLTDLLVNEGWEYGNASLQAQTDSAVVLSKINRKEMYSTTFDPSKIGYLIPIINPDGKIINHRYVMKEQTRRDVLKKDTRIDNVFGAMYESLTDKVESPKVNTEIVQELIKEHKTMYSNSPKGFIVVTENHPKYGEIYKLLPKEMKSQLDDYFGSGKLIVRESMMDIIFGYRKYSLFTEGDNSWLAKAMKAIFLDLLKVTPGKYYRRGRAFEQGWQEFIAELKSVIVLKTTVLGFNILSNTIVSFMHGMPLNYITKKQGEAILGVEEYINNHRKKLIYEQKLATIGISAKARANVQAKIVELEKDMASSPILPLIEAGLLNSIVEDITIDETDTGMKGELLGYIASKAKWIPKPIKTGYEIGQIGPKTGLYKLLEKTTRYSDFVARHAMYEWYTKEKRLGKDEALKIVSETFVNYDLPTSKELQYLNDMGAYMFTKYAVRIQKTLYRLLRDNPKSVVGLVVIENMFGNVTDTTDALSFGIGLPQNPINSIDEMFMPLYQLVMDIVGG